MKYAPYALYIAGSVLFLLGSVLSVWQMWRGA